MQDTGKTPTRLPVLIKRRQAAELAGWSIATLDRRERTDPNIPPRIAVGATGRGPFAYRYDQWRAYLDAMPTSRPTAPTPERSQAHVELAHKSAAARREKRDAKAAA
jgi:hypothetical protein